MRDSLNELVAQAVAGLIHLKAKVKKPAEAFKCLNEYTVGHPVLREEVVDGITYHHIELHWMHDGHSLKAHLVTNGNAFNFPEIKYSDIFEARHCELFLRSKKLIVNPLQENANTFNGTVVTLQPIFNKILELI